MSQLTQRHNGTNAVAELVEVIRASSGQIQVPRATGRTDAAPNRTRLREPAHGGVNGDLFMLAGHRDDGRLELVRRRDKKRVVWDLYERGAIDHGYATTSYRSQGRTVDSVFALRHGRGSPGAVC